MPVTESAARARAMNIPRMRSGSWRIRWVDANGKRQSATFSTYEAAQTALDAALQLRKEQEDAMALAGISNVAPQSWVKRWNDLVSPMPELPGVWRRRDGGYRIRGRAVDPKSGQLREVNRALPDCVSAEEAAEILRCETGDVRSQKQTGMVRQTKRSNGTRFQVYGMSAPCSSKCEHKECAKGIKRKVYVGTYESQSDANEALQKFNHNTQQPSGAVTSLRVIATYENGVERELRQFQVNEGDLLGFEAEEDDYLAFVVKHPRKRHAQSFEQQYRDWYFDDKPFDANAEVPF